MQIHTVKAGDTVFKIARRYATSPMKIIENNGLADPDRLAVGQKLLILTPTRTYTVRASDTLAKISERFDIPESALLASNPYLAGGDRIYPGQVLSVKFDAAPYGMACANGYYYRGTPKERLSLAMPYMTYATLAVGKRDGNGVALGFDASNIIEELKVNRKPPLMRVYDEELDFPDEYADNLILTASAHGYAGITLAAYRAVRYAKQKYADFLANLKRRLSECNMLLLAELDGNSDTDLVDVCDGYVIMYDKCSLDGIPTFSEGEEKTMREFARCGEASKTYIELPSFAYMGNEEITKKEAESLAYGAGKEILYDAERKICHYSYNKYTGGKRESVRVAYESLENAKNKLDLIGELGFMGICFDIMRVPTEYLMMFEAMFGHVAHYLSDGI